MRKLLLKALWGATKGFLSLFALWYYLGSFLEPHGIAFGLGFMSLGLFMAHVSAYKSATPPRKRDWGARFILAAPLLWLAYTQMLMFPWASAVLFGTYLGLAWEALDTFSVEESSRAPFRNRDP